MVSKEPLIMIKLNFKILMEKEKKTGVFPGSGEESTCQYRRHGFNPQSGTIPHAAEPLSPCGTTTELVP